MIYWVSTIRLVAQDFFQDISSMVSPSFTTVGLRQLVPCADVSG
jgi:hypothetical protein